MESQVTSSLWIPTMYPINMGYSVQKPPLTANKPVVHPSLISPPSVFLASHSNQLLVQIPQVIPILANNAAVHQVQSSVQNLIVQQPLPANPSHVISSTVDPLPHHGVLHHQHQQSHYKTCGDISSNNSNTTSNGINKIQKKKKVSPSAKRRSRLRLMAFLEAKRSASQTEETSSIDLQNVHKEEMLKNGIPKASSPPCIDEADNRVEQTINHKEPCNISTKNHSSEVICEERFQSSIAIDISGCS